MNDTDEKSVQCMKGLGYISNLFLFENPHLGVYIYMHCGYLNHFYQLIPLSLNNNILSKV